MFNDESENNNVRSMILIKGGEAYSAIEKYQISQPIATEIILFEVEKVSYAPAVLAVKIYFSTNQDPI